MVDLIFTADLWFDAIVQGLVYSLVAFGLLLIYRATGVINFAHGQIGAFGGYIMAVVYIRYDIPYALSLPLALATGVALGVLAELLLRRLFTQPRLLLFVATLGLTQVIQLLQLRLPIPDEQATSVTYPVLIDGSWEVAGITMSGPQLTVLLVVPVLMLFLGWLIHRSAFGMQVRAAADNLPAAQLAGISVRSVSTKVWALAGLLASLSALLIAPLQGSSLATVQTALGPKLLLLSLTAAMVGRMKSFSWTLVGGLVGGIADRILQALDLDDYVPTGSNIVVLFAILVVVLFTVGGSAGMKDDAWQLTTKVRAARADLVRHPLYRVLTIGSGLLLLAIAVGLPSQVDKPTDMLKFSTIPVYLIVALSVTVLTGWAGQLSLGQFGFVALGAYLTVYYSQELPYLASLGLGVAWGVAAALVVGVPALRLKGLYLAVVTLAFGLAIRSSIILTDKLSAGTGQAKLNVNRGKGFRLLFWEVKGNDFDGIYYFCLVVALVAIVLVWRIRRTGIGRSIIAVRDNEASAAAYTVAPARMKLLAFAVSGGLAALAGGLVPLTARNAQFKIDGLLFDFDESLRIVAVAVVGGIASITGAVLGTLVIVALPLIFDGTKQVELFASGVGMLIVLLYFPGGLVSIVHAGRDNLLAWLARRTNWTPRTRAESAAVGNLATKPSGAAGGGAAPLVVNDLVVNLGGRIIVDRVTLHVAPGEIVGLIGTNGAGKTTIVNAVSGFVPSTGRVELFGRDISSMPAHRRSRLGQGRAFQNARLFGSLTVRETLMVALESRQRSLFLPSVLALPPSPIAERRKRKEAEEIISYLGLGRYADSLMAELSTGTRRIVELGALIALDTKLMLLDEPTAGVAQKETEAFGPLIKSIRKELGAAILIIEHDMPMVMSISDRIYCLEAGQVIAEGVPSVIRDDPAVIASYLGTDQRAIDRSNVEG